MLLENSEIAVVCSRNKKIFGSLLEQCKGCEMDEQNRYCECFSPMVIYFRSEDIKNTTSSIDNKL